MSADGKGMPRTRTKAAAGAVVETVEEDAPRESVVEAVEAGDAPRDREPHDADAGEACDMEALPSEDALTRGLRKLHPLLTQLCGASQAHSILASALSVVDRYKRAGQKVPNFPSALLSCSMAMSGIEDVDEVRRNFLQKLVDCKLMTVQRMREEESLIIMTLPFEAATGL